MAFGSEYAKRLSIASTFLLVPFSNGYVAQGSSQIDQCVV